MNVNKFRLIERRSTILELEYYALFDGLELKMVCGISPEKPNELLRILEVAQMMYEAPTVKQIDQETYLLLKGALENELN